MNVKTECRVMSGHRASKVPSDGYCLTGLLKGDKEKVLGAENKSYQFGPG